MWKGKNAPPKVRFASPVLPPRPKFNPNMQQNLQWCALYPKYEIYFLHIPYQQRYTTLDVPSSSKNLQHNSKFLETTIDFCCYNFALQTPVDEIKQKIEQYINLHQFNLT